MKKKTVGINLKTIEIYKYLGFKTGVLEHYFIPNYKIIKNQIPNNSLIPKIGDLIFTGTPSGVGSVKIGDKLEGFINDARVFSLNIK